MDNIQAFCENYSTWAFDITLNVVLISIPYSFREGVCLLWSG